MLPSGVEPPHLVPETSALSTELREHECSNSNIHALGREKYKIAKNKGEANTRAI